MKFLVVFLCAVIAVTNGVFYRPVVRPFPRFPRYPLFPVFPQPFFPQQFAPQFPNLGDEYAASLAGAPIGTYSKSKSFGGNRGFQNGGSEVHGISLGNAKVGLYGNDRDNQNVPLFG